MIIRGNIMKKNTYEIFSEDFIAIRDIAFSKLSVEHGSNILKEKMDSLSIIRNTVISQGAEDEKEILVYCIDTLFDLIEEKEFATINDFCNAVHNIGLFLYVPRWNEGPTWSKSDYYDVFIFPFRQKYGRVYFMELSHYFKNPEESFKRAKIKKSLMSLIPKKKKAIKVNKTTIDKSGNVNK